MKKLAIVTTHPIQYNAPLYRLLKEEGAFQVKVFYTWSQSEKPVFDEGFGIVRTWDIPLLEGYEFQFVENKSKDPGLHHYKGIDNPSLINELLAYNPNAILVYGWNFKSHLQCLRFFKGKIPLLFRGDSTLLDESAGIKKILRRIFLTWVYRHIDYALFVGQNNKHYYLSHGIRENQLVFAPHAIDNNRFKENELLLEDKAKWQRKNLGIADSDSVILFAGKFEEKKDPECLIRLAKAMPEKNLKFLFVGNGLLEEKLKRAASTDNRIQFMGFQNQLAMPFIYRMADVFILPSLRNETWGLAINEAMACNRPVIASTKVGCVPDLVKDNFNGWAFEPGLGSEDKLIAKINNTLQSKGRLKEMGINAAHTIESYSFSTIGKSLNALMARLD
jgi:glycosyltransferase involved in cell wall biosynthesis